MGYGAKLDQDLLESGIIYLSGDINNEMAAYMGKAITWLNRKVPEDEKIEEILLYIDSSEGKLVSALDIFDIIRFSRIPVTGIVYHRAISAAAIVLLACHKRVAMQNAVIEFHPVKAMELTFKDLEGDLDTTLKKSRELQDACTKIVASHKLRCESLEHAWAFIKYALSMSAEDALDEGFLDHVFYTVPTYMPYYTEQIVKRANRDF